jgi:hypothetical protein
MLATGAIRAQEICQKISQENSQEVCQIGMAEVTNAGAVTTMAMKRGKAEKWAARSERLAASLRENLKRRKVQARGRTAPQSLDAGSRSEGTEGAAPKSDFRRNPNGN